MLRGAVATNTLVDMNYMALATNEMSSREVEPWAVFSSLGNWYLSAFCRLKQEERVFRVDRIQQATLVDESFVPPEDLPKPEVTIHAI